MTIEDVINYVYSTPENSNPNVLRDMLQEIANNTTTSSSDFGFVTLTIQNTDPSTSIYFNGYIIDNGYIYNLETAIINTETLELISYQGKAPFILEADSISSLGGATSVGGITYFITDNTTIIGTGFESHGGFNAE